MDIVAIDALLKDILNEVSVRMVATYAEVAPIDTGHPLAQEGLPTQPARRVGKVVPHRWKPTVHKAEPVKDHAALVDPTDCSVQKWWF